MTVLKCKMCGGDLAITEGHSTAECEYCGSIQTVPNADDEKKLSAFARAHRLRAICEFDKAAGVYETIISDFPEEAEAYWGLVLCKYGIEYVDDPATGKKIPTCHRSSFDSVMDDENLELALEYADSVARKIYREEAKQIEELRKDIIEVSAKEEPYDIFICYKETDENGDRTIDSVLAQDIYDELAAKGYRVFFARITLEDKLGLEYEPYIFAALNSAKLMLAIGTDYEYYNAVWVKNEWSRFLKLMAADKSKHLIPCYKDIDAYDMPKEFSKLQAQDLGKVGATQDLLRGIEKLLPKKESEVIKETVAATVSASSPSVDSLLKRAFMFLEDRDWQSANDYCEKVLDIDPECAEAYLGKLMAYLKVEKREDLANLEKPFDNVFGYSKAIRFGNDSLKAELEGYLKRIKDNIKNTKSKEIYDRAIADLKSELYASAVEQFRSIQGYRDSDERANECSEKLQRLKEKLSEKRNQIAPFQKLIATGAWESVGLKTDGTLLSSCGCDYPWEDVVAITAAQAETIALLADGTVCSDEEEDEEEDDEYDLMFDLTNWKNIIDISGGVVDIIGKKKDGSVLVAGENVDEHKSVLRWENVDMISIGCGLAVCLHNDKTVSVSGKTESEIDTNKWKDIVSVSCGEDHILGLRSDGTVLSAGYNEHGQCNTQSWRNIVAVSAGQDFSVGLTIDGTVIATEYLGDQTWNDGQCDKYNWNNIIAIRTGPSSRHTLGLRSDGTVLAQGRNEEEQCDVSDWKLFNSMDTYEEECRIARQKRREQREAEQQQRLEEQRLQEELRKLQTSRRLSGVCQHCGGELKGLFSKKCVSCGKPKDY